MSSEIKYSLKMNLSKLPNDIIPSIRAHLTDCSVLDYSLKGIRENNDLSSIFFIKICQKMQNNIINC